MYRKYLAKRALYGLLMYAVMVFTYSAIFNKVAEETARAQIEEEVAQAALQLKDASEERLKAFIASEREARMHRHHLDQGYAARVLWRGWDSLTFNFGNSTIMRAPDGDRSVIGIIGEALPRTILLFGSEVVLVVVIGTTLGLYAARRPGGLLDRAISTITMATNGLPSWWMGMLMIMAFSQTIHLFPSSGLHSSPAPAGLAGAADLAWHLALPLITLVCLGVWGSAYLVRNISLSSLQEDYVMAARARGIAERRVLFGHSLRTSMPAILTMAVLSLFGSIAGNIIVEGVFGWPGIGNLYFVAVQQNDIPVLMGTLSIQTFVNMAGFVLLDFAYGFLDPRIRTGGRG